MTASPQCVFQLVLTKPILCQGKRKMHLNTRSSNPSNASEDSVDQTSRARWTKYASQHVLSKPIPSQRGHKMSLNMCWPNTPMPEITHNVSQLDLNKPLHAFEDTKCITTCVDQTPHIPARTQNACQHVLTKFIQCKRRHKKHVNVYCQRRQNIHLTMC